LKKRRPEQKPQPNNENVKTTLEPVLPRKTNLADRSSWGKLNKYQEADLREILGVFEDYKRAENSIRSKLK
jgi:hypothetical protein